MLCVGLGVRLIAVCLACLGKQDKWSSIGCLETKSEIEQDKRIDIELGKSKDVQPNPDCDYYGLGNEKNRCPEKTGESLGLQREPIISEYGAKMQVRKMEAEVVMRRSGGWDGFRCFCVCFHGFSFVNFAVAF